MRVVTLDDDRRRLDASLVAVRLLDQLDVELSPLRPAHVHAQQHARPVAALGAARSGMHFDIGVVGVGLARKQRFELAPLALGFQRPQSADPLGFSRFVAFGFAKLDQRRRVVEVALDLRQRAQPVFQHACARASPFRRFRDRSRGSGSSDFALSSPRRRDAASTSKMPPQQSHGLLDRFDQLFGFGAHDPTNEFKGARSPSETAPSDATAARSPCRAEWRLDRSEKTEASQ